MKKTVIGIFMLLAIVGFSLAFSFTKSVYFFDILSLPYTLNNQWSGTIEHQNGMQDEQIIQDIIAINKKNKTSFYKIETSYDGTKGFIYIEDAKTFRDSGVYLTKSEMIHLNTQKGLFLTNNLYQKAIRYFPSFPCDISMNYYGIQSMERVDGNYYFFGD